MASVLPRLSSTGQVTWRVQFRVDGRMRQESFTDDKGAHEFGRLVDKVGGEAARRVLEARKGRTPDVPTLREFTDRYLSLDSGLLTGIEPGTREGYRRAAERSFLPVLGDYPIDALGKADVGRWVAWQEAQPSTARKGQLVAAKTVKNYHAILSSVLSSAVNEGIINGNPAYRTRLSKGRAEEAVFLSPEEFSTLLYFIPDRYQSFVLFLAGTGMRWGEATAVTWGDLTLHTSPPTVRVDKAWKKSATGSPVLKHPKSSRARRTISLSADVLDALGTPGPADQLIFPGQFSGGHLWYGRFRTTTWVPAVARAMDAELCAEAGLTPLTKAPSIHDCRHSHASWLIARGAPLPLLQNRLGHESITTTVNTYGHLQPDAHMQMADLIGATLSGARTLRQIGA